MMMFGFIRTITFNIFSFLDSAQKGKISLLPAILVLRDARVHVCTYDGGDIAFYIKVPINQFFHFTTTLNIPDVHQNNDHIQLGEVFDNEWLRYQNNIVEDVVFLDDIFNHTQSNRGNCIFLKIRNIYNFKIELGLGELWNFNSIQIDMLSILHIILDHLKV